MSDRLWHKVALQVAGFWACEWPLSGAEATKWRDPLFGGYRRKAVQIMWYRIGKKSTQSDARES